jgi:crossover junction endodeoxyribonuclease RuvC
MSGRLQLVDHGVLRVKGVLFPERLAYIYHSLCDIIKKYQPDEAGVEQVFSAKNVMSTIKLAQARGAAIASCASFHIPVLDYEPTLVKKTLVGNGRAEKEQVAFMVCRLLGQTHIEGPLDTSDALGVAVCHLTLRRFRRLEDLRRQEILKEI